MGDLDPARSLSRRRALLLVAAAALAGCSSGSAGSNEKTGAADDAGVQGGAGAPTTDFNGCVYVKVDAAQRSAPAQLSATSMLGTGQGHAWKYRWKVTRAGDATPVPFTTRDVDGTAIDVTATDPGTYHFALSITASDGSTPPCTGEDTELVTPPGATQSFVRLHVVPPAGTNLPVQEQLVSVWSGTPMDEQAVTLGEGALVQSTLAGPNGGLPGAVRFLSASGRLDALAAAGSDGSFRALLVPGEQYKLVLLPSATTVAPRLVDTFSDGAALRTASFSVQAGVTVAGVVKDDQGAPLAGAEVVLRRGPLASAVAVTDGTGAYALRVEPGSYDVAVAAAGWPDVASLASLTVAADAMLDVAYRASRVAVAAHVLPADASAGARGGRVTLRSTGPIANVAQLAFAGGSLPTSGVARFGGTLDGNGDVTGATVPPGDYVAVVEPPAGSSDALLSQPVTIGQATTLKLALAPRAMLTGTVAGAAGPVADALVVVEERLPLGVGPSPTLTTHTDAQGRYKLSVDGGADLTVTIDPPAGALSSTAPRRVALTAKAGTTRLDATVPSGTLLAGRLAPPSGAALEGATVEARWDTAGAPEGPPIAVSTTNVDGRFVLYLPDSP